MYPPGIPVSIAMTFTTAHIFHRCSSQRIVYCKTWKFLYVSFMWATWANGIEGNYFHFGVKLHSNWPNMNQWRASIDQRCVQVTIFSLILECYCITLVHQPLSNMFVCLTASSYIIYYYTFLKKIPLFRRDQCSRAFVVLLWWNDVFSLSWTITLQVKGKLNSWKPAFAFWEIDWDNIILGI